jgi:predicted nucleic acid-binding protein
MVRGGHGIMSILVFDATTLIHLGKIDLLVHFKDLDHELLLPLSIYEEVVLKGKQKGVLDAMRTEELVSSGIIKIIDVKKGEMHERLSGNGSLSRSDLDVLELAHSRSGIAIMDESYGRAVCDIENIKHKGTIWVLGQFLISGYITKEEAREDLDRLIEEGWHCSTQFYSKALGMINGRS